LKRFAVRPADAEAYDKPGSLVRAFDELTAVIHGDESGCELGNCRCDCGCTTLVGCTAHMSALCMGCIRGC
jgi:hypothetical protein